MLVIIWWLWAKSQVFSYSFFQLSIIWWGPPPEERKRWHPWCDGADPALQSEVMQVFLVILWSWKFWIFFLWILVYTVCCSHSTKLQFFMHCLIREFTSFFLFFYTYNCPNKPLYLTSQSYNKLESPVLDLPINVHVTLISHILTLCILWGKNMAHKPNWKKKVPFMQTCTNST